MLTKTRIRAIAGSMLLLTVLMAGQGCKKSSGGDGSATNTSGYYLTASIGGKDWAANVNSPGLDNSPSIGVVTPFNGGALMLVLGIKAVNKDTTSLVLVFPQNVTLNKALTLDATKNLEIAYVAETAAGSGAYYGYNTTPATGGSGTLTITSFDQTAKVIEGTFSGVLGSQTGRAAISFTNGKFRCIYTTNIQQLPPGVKF